jgi:phage tail-like protein
MDVNGTRFHLLLGEADWGPVARGSRVPPSYAVDWAADDSVRSAVVTTPLEWYPDFGGVALTRLLPRIPPPAGTLPLAADARRGACADAYGNLFWIDDDEKRIRVKPAALDAAGEFWNPAALEPAADTPRGELFRPASAAAPIEVPRLRGLAVTTGHYLIAGTLAPGGLLVFDLHASGEPLWWRWPAALAFAPLALAPCSDGGLLVLDRRESGAARLWRLDARLAPVDLGTPITLTPAQSALFHTQGEPASARPPLTFPAPVQLGAGMAVPAQDPVAMAALPDGSVLILDAADGVQPSRLHRVRGGVLASSMALDVTDTALRLRTPVVGAHAMAVIADPADAQGAVQGTLWLATLDAAQALEFGLRADGAELALELRPRALPLQRFSGKALAAAGGEVYYDSGERWIMLAEQPRYRYFPAAILEGDPLVFDGKEPGCVWHRLMLDASIPPGCAVEIQTRADDERSRLAQAPWRKQAALYQRAEGSELPFDRPFATSAGAYAGTWETLIDEATGRYLQLRMVVRGDGRASPRLRALRLYYPRFSYLREYLPAVYREDAQSASFVERFLCNAEGLLSALEGRIERAELLLDPAVAPPEWLDWLADWLGTMLDENWDEDRRRLFLRHAWLLFRWRGTPQALIALLRLATDACVDDSIFAPLQAVESSTICTAPAGGLRIVESFLLRRYQAAQLGDPTAVAGPGLAAPGRRWQVSDGGAALHTRYACFLYERYRERGDASPGDALARLAQAWGLESAPASFELLRFSAVLPASAAQQRDWQDFAAIAFEFSYATVRVGDLDAWRAFLAERYGHIDALNVAYGRSGAARWASFAQVPLPDEDWFPDDGKPLADWIEFASVVLPLRRDAHRFTVLVPTRPDEPPAERERRLAVIDRIVQRERPAHTDSEVKPFWALFRVGSARVGLDTQLGDSGRFVAMVLDAGYLGQGWLAEGQPWSAADRSVIGRDRIQG